MKRVFVIVTLMAAAGCVGERDSMSPNNLPEGWTAGDPVPHNEIYSDPPESPDSGRIQFYGLLGSELGHRLYSIPLDTPIEKVVKVFEVGSHAAISYHYNADETVALVADKATRISELVPCRVTFADAAGLKLKFSRPITDKDVKQIEALFSEEEHMRAGLERYLSEWDGESSLLAPVMQEKFFHFWWD